ncbi:hypothetical protein ACFLTH_13095 [Bacteroidota bacterium]
MEKIERKLLLMAVMLLLTVTVIGMVFADPAGTGTLTPSSSARGNDPSAGNLSAQGGNVTNIDIDSQSITTKWAGFYGDVTGGISLEDGSGNAFYNWSDASPTGEVFATRDSNPTWGSIACASAGNVNTEADELDLTAGMDNLTSTFCETCGNHTAFDVAAASFTADQCTFRTNAYNSTGSQTDNWDQILLWEGTNVVYTTIINQDTDGFTGSNYDFQLLVGENSSTSVLTQYYFFVEIA